MLSPWPRLAPLFANRSASLPCFGHWSSQWAPRERPGSSRRHSRRPQGRPRGAPGHPKGAPGHPKEGKLAFSKNSTALQPQQLFHLPGPPGRSGAPKSALRTLTGPPEGAQGRPRTLQVRPLDPPEGARGRPGSSQGPPLGTPRRLGEPKATPGTPQG